MSATTTGLVPEAAELYGLEPAAFVEARNRLARDLKAQGRRYDAAVVGKLRRPAVGEHALNVAARRRPDVARAWADAVTSVADAQDAAISTGDAARLRQATADLAAATGELVAVATSDDENKPNEVLAAVRKVTTRTGAVLVASGIVGSANPDEELFGGAPEPPARPDAPADRGTSTRKGSAKAARGGARVRSPEASPTSGGQPAPRPDPQADRDDVDAARQAAEHAAATADDERDRAQADVDRQQADVDRAQAALHVAHEELGEAHAELRRAQERLGLAQERLGPAEADLERTRRALERSQDVLRRVAAAAADARRGLAD